MADDKKVKTSTQEELAKLKAQQLAKAPKLSFDSIGQFFKETWIELKKTTWPDKNTLAKSTYIVLAFIGAAAIWVGGIDFILTTATKKLTGH